MHFTNAKLRLSRITSVIIKEKYLNSWNVKTYLSFILSNVKEFYWIFHQVCIHYRGLLLKTKFTRSNSCLCVTPMTCLSDQILWEFVLFLLKLFTNALVITEEHSHSGIMMSFGVRLVRLYIYDIVCNLSIQNV